MDKDYVTKYYNKKLIDAPKFHYEEDVDDYGRSSSTLEVTTPDGMGYVPKIIEWSVFLILVGNPYLVWITANRVYKFSQEENIDL